VWLHFEFWYGALHWPTLQHEKMCNNVMDMRCNAILFHCCKVIANKRLIYMEIRGENSCLFIVEILWLDIWMWGFISHQVVSPFVCQSSRNERHRSVALFPLVVNFIRSASRHFSGFQHKVKYDYFTTRLNILVKKLSIWAAHIDVCCYITAER